MIRGTHDDADVVAKLQPILDAKKKLVDLDAQMKDQQRAIGEVNAEEARLRQNIAALKGSAEEKPLSKRYVEAMAAQEDKLTALNSQREAARQARDSTQKTLTEQIRSLQTDLPIPKA